MSASSRYIKFALLLSFVCVIFEWHVVGVAVLFLGTLYYAYWALNHKLSHAKLEAFVYYFLLLVFTIATFTAIYEMEGIICSGVVVRETYTSFYFSVVTWTTLGYGDCLPTEDIRHLAAIQALMGYLMMAIFIGVFMSLMVNQGTEQNAPNK